MSEPKSRRIPKPIWFAALAVPMVGLWVFLSVWLPYHREQAAIREIEKLGGNASPDWIGLDWIEDGPEWMQQIVKSRWLSWFHRVEHVFLGEIRVSDGGLIDLSGLTRLNTLISKTHSSTMKN